MKKIYSLIYVLIYIGIGTVKAQYTKLLDFNGTNGTQPYGSVILSGNDSVLYGMTNGGGSTGDNGGTIFSIHTDGSAYLNLHNFNMIDTSGSNPLGSLIRSGNVLYGMTSGYGLYGKGTIFSINTDGSGYTKLYDFPVISDSLFDIGGGNPDGSLMLFGNVLYGMTYGAGGPNMGNVFSIHTDGSGYTNLLDFTGTNGAHPGYGALTLSGSMLYGTTLYGGTYGSGVLFSIDTNGTGYNKLIDFNTANGEIPFGSLTLSGSVLYGNTDGGGTYGKGTIFSIHTDGTGYTKLFDFNGANGGSPMGSLTLSGSMLYGTTGSFGANGFGTVFSIDTSGSGMQTLFNFNTPTGTQPRATLSLSGTTLYGTTVIGGTYDDGVVFSLETHPSGVPICMVTVDYSSNYNHIVWENPITTSIDSFIVFRETTTNNYQPIGALPYAAASEFIDTVRARYFPFTGDPNAGSYRYKIQVRDTSGNYSSLSQYHNTIFITQAGGTFNWNPYQVEGQPMPSLFAYVLYRDDNSTGVWHSIQAVSGTATSVADPNFASFPNGRWRVETVWGISCSSGASISNVKSAIVSGIAENQFSSGVKVYPNPANDFIDVETDLKNCNVSVFDDTGRLIFKQTIQNKTRINLPGFSKGLYLIQLESEGSIISKRFIKE